MGSPSVKEPEMTPQQKAFEEAQARQLSQEITEENRRRKALVRGTLGAQSLLTGAPGGPAAPAPAAPTPAAPGGSNQPTMQGNQGRRGPRMPMTGS